MSAQDFIVGIGASLLVNEFCDVSPWAARKLVIWSAYLRYGKSARAETRAEELAALIDSRPGKLFKLVTALGFTGGATWTYVHRAVVMFLLWYLIATTRLTVRGRNGDSAVEMSLWKALKTAQQTTD
ncbi:hypothetical protein ACOZ38_25315 [Sphaerisporangium viridialbum]|uniref:hypothetical protein n=1 Tax=Sphaerisporangium viridialbum TaxID=46189 RepID=UPI003C75FF56